MTLVEFQQSVSTSSAPPAGMSPALQALWWAAKGDWDRAHTLAQSDDGSEASWVHAFLHRQEGDEANASYWYTKAARAMARGSLDAERNQIAGELLERGG